MTKKKTTKQSGKHLGAAKPRPSAKAVVVDHGKVADPVADATAASSPNAPPESGNSAPAACRDQPRLVAGAPTDAMPAEPATTRPTDAPRATAGGAGDLPEVPSPSRIRDPRLPLVGTVLIKRDRHGVERARCTMVEGGTEYNGTVYRSISAAALVAAKDLGLGGTTQDGFAFWQLKKAATRVVSKKDRISQIESAWDRYHKRVVEAVAAVASIHDDDGGPSLRAAIRQHLNVLSELAVDRR